MADNFRLFVEGIEGETVTIRLRGYAADDFLAQLNRPREFSPFFAWLGKYVSQKSSSVVLNIPVNMHTYSRITQLIDFSLNLVGGNTIIKKLKPLHHKLYQDNRFLVKIIQTAPDEWRRRLYDALWNNPDNAPWLVYSDYLEERGNNVDAEKIKELFKKN